MSWACVGCERFAFPEADVLCFWCRRRQAEGVPLPSSSVSPIPSPSDNRPTVFDLAPARGSRKRPAAPDNPTLF